MTGSDRSKPDADEVAEASGGHEGGMREGLDREYASMGTGEAGAGVGGGGSTSSDVEWEETAGGAMMNEQELGERGA